MKKKKIIIRNLFRLKNELNDPAIKDIKTIKDKILRYIKNLFEHEKEENYHKPVRVNYFWSNNYNEYKSNGDIIRTLSVEEYLYKIRPYLKCIINNLKKSATWKIQVTIENNFISSVNNDKACIMHSKKR